MREPHDGCEKACGPHRLRSSELLNLQFKILRQQLSNENGTVEQPGRDHALSEIWREVARAFHHAFGVIARCFIIAVPRSCGYARLLHINKTQAAAAGLFAFHCEQHGEPKTPE
jgi:hypothetical protein